MYIALELTSTVEAVSSKAIPALAHSPTVTQIEANRVSTASTVVDAARIWRYCINTIDSTIVSEPLLMVVMAIFDQSSIRIQGKVDSFEFTSK